VGGDSGLLMLPSVAKYLMSGEYGPFDRFVELGVFLLVGYEVVMGMRHHRKARSRERCVTQRVAALREAWSKGQELLLSVPGSGAPRVAEWATAVSEWNEETRVLLKSYSAHAEAAFMLRIPESPNRYGSIGAVFEYISLLSGVSNLRGIIEKPDVYF
jgi:hypothetical protein